jgi:hypothetical protein
MSCIFGMNYSERLQIMIHWYGAVLKSTTEKYKIAVNCGHSWWPSNINELPYKIPIFVINDTSRLGSYVTFIPISESGHLLMLCSDTEVWYSSFQIVLTDIRLEQQVSSDKATVLWCV